MIPNLTKSVTNSESNQMSHSKEINCLFKMEKMIEFKLKKKIKNLHSLRILISIIFDLINLGTIVITSCVRLKIFLLNILIRIFTL